MIIRHNRKCKYYHVTKSYHTYSIAIQQQLFTTFLLLLSHTMLYTTIAQISKATGYTRGQIDQLLRRGKIKELEIDPWLYDNKPKKYTRIKQTNGKFYVYDISWIDKIQNNQ